MEIQPPRSGATRNTPPWPASRIAANTLGESKRGQQYQSIVPSVPTSATVCRSPIKPRSAIFDKDRVVFFDSVPTSINYAVTLLGRSRSEAATAAGDTFGVGGASSYDSRQTLIDSIVVAVGSAALTMLLAVLAAYALSRFAFRGRQAYLGWVLSQRFMPPIAIIVPIVFMFHYLACATRWAASSSSIR